MVIAAESLGLGSCFLGGAPYEADQIIKAYGLPRRVSKLTLSVPVWNRIMSYLALDSVR